MMKLMNYFLASLMEKKDFSSHAYFDVRNKNESRVDLPVPSINAGVLLINNQELRKDHNLSEKLLDFARKNNFPAR